MNRLSVTWDRLRNVPGLGRDVLLVALVLALGLFASVYIVSRYDVITPWSDKYEFSAEFDQAPAIQLSSVPGRGTTVQLTLPAFTGRSDPI